MKIITNKILQNNQENLQIILLVKKEIQYLYIKEKLPQINMILLKRNIKKKLDKQNKLIRIT